MASNVITALNLRIGFDISEFETKNQDMRKALARTTTILRSMATPAEKLANDIKSVTMVAEEQKWETQKLDQALEHLNRKYDLTGQYAREAKQAQQELANVAKQVADEERKAAKAAEDAARAMAKQEKAVAWTYVRDELEKIEAEERRVAKAAEDAAKAMAKQEKAVAWAYVREELEKIESEERQIAKAAEDAARAMAKQEKAIAWAYVREELEKIDEEERRIAKAAEDAAKAMQKQEKAVAWAYVREELEKIEQEERAAAAASDRHAKALERVGWGASQYDKELQRLSKDLSEGSIDTNQYRTQLEALREYYERAPARAKATAEQEERLNNARKIAAKYIKQEVSASDQYRQVQKALKVLLKQKQLTVDEYKKQRDAAYREIVVNKDLAKNIQSLADEYAKEKRNLDARNKARSDATKQLSKENATTSSLLVNVKRLFAAYAGFATIRSGIKIAADIEQASIAFEVMSGSAEKGRKVLSEVRAFAASTPITFEGAQKSAKTLLQFGVSADMVSSRLKMLGDIAAGDTQRLEHLALAFGQVAAAGRLTGQETLQMINQGFNPLQQIAEDMAEEFGGLADDYFPMLKQQMEQGNISAEMVAQAIESATSAGGRFAGMTDKMGETATGKFNQLVGAAQELAFTIGEAGVLDGIKSLTEAVTYLVKLVNETINTFQSWQVKLIAVSAAAAAGMYAGAKYAHTIVALGSAIKALNLVEIARLALSGKIVKAYKALRAAIAANNAVLIIQKALSGPVGWAMLGGAAAAAGVAYLAVNKIMDETNEKLSENQEELEKAAEKTDKYRKGLENLRNARKQEGEDARKFLDETTKQLDEQLKKLQMTERQIFENQVYAQRMLPIQKERLMRKYDELQLMKDAKGLSDFHDKQRIEAAKTEDQIRQLRFQGLITAVELQEKLADLEKKRLKIAEELASKGKAISEKYDPALKVAEGLADLNVLLRTGNITMEEFLAERESLLRKNAGIDKMSPVEASKRGSQEMVDFLTGQQADIQQQQLEKQEAQRLLQEAQLRAQEITNRKLGELQAVGVIRK